MRTESGNNYFRTYKTNEIKEPYETVEDWLKSLTGNKSHLQQFSYVVNEMVEEYLINEAKEEYDTDELDYKELDEERYEFIGSIERLPISELKKY